MKREDPLQGAIVDYIEAVLPDAIVFAIPNAARRWAGGKAGNAVPGLKRGMPDVGILIEDGFIYLLEVKDPVKGKLSQQQIDMHAELKRRRVPVETVSSIEDVRRVLRDTFHLATREASYEPSKDLVGHGNARFGEPRLGAARSGVGRHGRVRRGMEGGEGRTRRKRM
jgi:hypothetical protein